MGNEMHDDKLTPYHSDDDGDDWDLVNVLLTLPLSFVPVPAETSTTFSSSSIRPMLPYMRRLTVSFSWPLQNIYGITERNSAEPANAGTLERVCNVEETAAASLGGKILKMVDMGPKPNAKKQSVFQTQIDCGSKTIFWPINQEIFAS